MGRIMGLIRGILHTIKIPLLRRAWECQCAALQLSLSAPGIPVSCAVPAGRVFLRTAATPLCLSFLITFPCWVMGITQSCSVVWREWWTCLDLCLNLHCHPKGLVPLGWGAAVTDGGVYVLAGDGAEQDWWLLGRSVKLSAGLNLFQS